MMRQFLGQHLFPVSPASVGQPHPDEMRDLMYQDALKFSAPSQYLRIQEDDPPRDRCGGEVRPQRPAYANLNRPPGEQRQHQGLGAGAPGKYFPGCKKNSGFRTDG